MSTPNRNKNSHLWNVQEPGDPYDIKRSMIAKLPNHPSKPMGEHLELVCLLQSAQIERLTECLNQLQIRYRQVEKRELDRHSYQIQIKELADKNITYSNMKVENDRLKDFIRRQSLELEELQKLNLQIRNVEALSAKYEGVLNQLRLSREQNQRSEQQISRLNMDIAEWKGKCQRLELEKVTLKSQFDLQINQKIAIEIKQSLVQAQQKNHRLQVELRQVRQNLDNKNNEIHILTSQQDQILRQMRVLEEKSRTHGNIQSSLMLKNRQIQKLQLIVEEKSIKLEQSQSTVHRLSGDLRILEDRIHLLQKDKQSLINQVRQLEQLKSKNETFDKYEQRVAMMSMEIQRLNNINVTRSREFNDKCIENERCKDEIKQLNQKIRRNQADLNAMAIHEQKISLLSQELQRITLQLRTKNDQIHSLHQKITITESTSSQLQIVSSQKSRLQQELQAARTEHRNYKNITDSQINTLKSECNKLRHELGLQAGCKPELQKYKTECQRLRGELERLRNQNISFRRTVEDEKNNNIKLISERNQLAEERNRLISEINNLIEENKRIGNQIIQVRRDMQEFKTLARDMNEKDKLIRDLQLQLQTKDEHYLTIQKTLENVYKEIQRLHSVLSAKTNEQMQGAKQFNLLEQRYRILQAKMASSSNDKHQHEHQIKTYQLQIETLNRYKSQLTMQIEAKNRQIRAVTENCQYSLRDKDKIISQHVKEKQVLERKLIELQRELAQRVPHQEQIAQQYQRALQEARQKDSMIKRLQNNIEDLQRIYQEKERQFKDWESKVLEWESRLKEAQRLLKSKDDEINRLNIEKIRLSQEVGNLSQDMSRLNSEVANSKFKKQDQLRFKDKIDGLTQENIKLRMRMDELERGRATSEDSIRLQLQRAEETIALERGQNDALRQKLQKQEDRILTQDRQLLTVRETIKEYQMKIVHIENTNSKVLQEKLTQYEIKLQERDALIVKLQQEIKQIQAQFGQYVDKDRTTLMSLSQYQNKIALLSTQFQRLNKMVEDKTQENRDKDRTISQLRQDLGKLVNQLQQKDQLIDTLKVKLSQPVQTQNNQQNTIEIANLKTAIEQLQNINIHALAERDELFKVSHQIKIQYEGNLARMVEEQKKLRAELKYRLDENRALGQELGQLRKKQQSYILQIRELDGRSRQEDPNMRRRLAQQEQVIANYKQEMNSLNILNTNLRTQINQLQIMLQETRVKGDNREQLGSLTIKLNEYSQLLNAKEEDVAYWENKYTGLYTAYEELYTNYNLTKSEYEITINNIKIYETKMFKLEEDFSALSDALRNTKLQLESFQQQNYDLKHKLRGDSDLYEKNLLLSKEIDRLTDVSQLMKQDLTDTRMRLTDNVSLNKRIEEQLGLFVVLFAEIQSLRSRLANSEQECEEVRRNSLVPLRVDRSMPPRP